MLQLNHALDQAVNPPQHNYMQLESHQAHTLLQQERCASRSLWNPRQSQKMSPQVQKICYMFRTAKEGSQGTAHQDANCWSVTGAGVVLNDSPAQGLSKRRKLLLLSRQGEPEPAASISTPVKHTNCKQEPRKALQSTSIAGGPSPAKVHKSTQQSAAACEKPSSRALTPGT